MVIRRLRFYYLLDRIKLYRNLLYTYYNYLKEIFNSEKQLYSSHYNNTYIQSDLLDDRMNNDYPEDDKDDYPEDDKDDELKELIDINDINDIEEGFSPSKHKWIYD